MTAPRIARAAHRARRARRVVTAACLTTIAIGVATDARVAEAQAQATSRGPRLSWLRRNNDTATTSYTVSGVRVLHRRVTANDVVAANLYLLGGTRQVADSTAGIEALLLETSERGTRKYGKAALRERMARLGSAIVVAPSADWTLYGFRSTTRGFDSTWVLWADRLMAPRLDSTEFEQVRGQFLSAVRQRRESPDALLEYLADSAAYAGHPYGLSPTGTERSIGRLTLRELRRYQASEMTTSRMLLVVVGNVSRERIEALVRTTIGRLPAGKFAWKAPATPVARTTATVAVESRALPTNYILGYYGGPAASSADYAAMRVASAVLSGRLFAEIRSRRNLTYAVHAPFVERALASTGLYVTATAPDTTLALMRGEVDDLKTHLIDGEALERLIQQFITEYFLDNETNSDQANFLARAQLYRGDWRTADRFVDELRRVTPEDVRRVARTYLVRPAFAYVGDPRRLSERVIRGF